MRHAGHVQAAAAATQQLQQRARLPGNSMLVHLYPTRKALILFPSSSFMHDLSQDSEELLWPGS